MKYDVIIIGAGASGLMAMQELLEAGYQCLLLEASSVPGGRIATLLPKGFEHQVEAGAEFIHGKLPLTLQLLRKANIHYEPVEGKMISVQQGHWNESAIHDPHWDELMKKLRRQKKDITIRTFLDTHFPERVYANLRKAAQKFAEGFDLASIDDASILSVRKEWLHEQQTQYRIPGGYSQLIDYLLSNCLAMEGIVEFNCAVKHIEYQKVSVKVTTIGKKSFEANRVIVCVPAGVLQSGDIKFKPSLTIHGDSIKQLGFGAVIKIILQFYEPFWKSRDDAIGFLITDEVIPTWWTQLPARNSILTGWLGGPVAARRSKDSEEILLRDALLSLSFIFHCKPQELKKQLVQHSIHCWKQQEFIKGGYSYNTLFSEKAVEILSEPVLESLFFAGEAIYCGSAQGTVEAALQSGRSAARKIIKMDK